MVVRVLRLASAISCTPSAMRICIEPLHQAREQLSREPRALPKLRLITK